jgi:hypothetical protein
MKAQKNFSQIATINTPFMLIYQQNTTINTNILIIGEQYASNMVDKCSTFVHKTHQLTGANGYILLPNLAHYTINCNPFSLYLSPHVLNPTAQPNNYTPLYVNDYVTIYERHHECHYVRLLP